MTLIDGWEPEVEAGDSLVRRFVYAYADRTAAMAALLGGRSQADADAAYADAGSAFIYDNAVVLKRPPAPGTVEEVVRRAYEFFPPRRSWALLSVFPLGDLQRMGLTLDGHPPLMVRPAADAAEVKRPDGLVIEEVRTAEHLADFDRVIVAGYPGITAGGSIANPAVVAAGAVRLFVGYLDGAPVATAGAAINHEIVEVDWICTLPEHRGRGIGAAMTQVATYVEPSLPAALIASDEGRPVYEKLGYVNVFRATLWTRLPEWSRPL